MQRVVQLVGIIITLQALVACGVASRLSTPPQEIKSADSAIVYGYVEADNDIIEQVDFVEYGKVYVSPFKFPPRVLVFDNGMFMAENIKPGTYVIASFRSEHNFYNLTRSQRQFYQRIFRIEPGEVQYLGSFNLHITKKGRIDFGDFKVTEIQRPGERDVLKHLFHVTEGTAWQNKIARRLKELSQ